jgi:DNA-binding transcriptional ArsR family regulator
VTRHTDEAQAELFKTLAHPARIRILEVLRDGEHSVGELAPKVGIEASHLSQQLSTLRRANLVQSRRQGSSVYYSAADPRVFQLLTTARQVLSSTLAETRDLLADLETLDGTDAFARRPKTRR